MLKQRIFKVVIGLAMLAAVLGSSGIVADSFGLSLTPEAHACNASGGSTGGC